jgi:hypothetical protein
MTKRQINAGTRVTPTNGATAKVHDGAARRIIRKSAIAASSAITANIAAAQKDVADALDTVGKNEKSGKTRRHAARRLLEKERAHRKATR